MRDQASHRDQAPKTEVKRVFVRPELRREGELPKITNALTGTHDGQALGG